VRGSDIFDIYRQLLTLVVSSYVVVRTVNSIWRWQSATQSAPKWEAAARRYVVTQLLRVRLRRFALDLLQIGAAAGVLACLIWLHSRRG